MRRDAGMCDSVWPTTRDVPADGPLGEDLDKGNEDKTDCQQHDNSSIHDHGPVTLLRIRWNIPPADGWSPFNCSLTMPNRRSRD